MESTQKGFMHSNNDYIHQIEQFPFPQSTPGAAFTKIV